MAAFLRSQTPAAIPILTTSKVLLGGKHSPLSQKPSFWGCVLDGTVRKCSVCESQRLDRMKQGDNRDQSRGKEHELWRDNLR